MLVNFGNHPDTVGGCKISGDWPAFTRKFVEKAIDNTKCIFFNGAEGDVNHVNVKPNAGDFNDCQEDFDGWYKPLDKNAHVCIFDKPHEKILDISWYGHKMKIEINYCPMCRKRVERS